MSLHLAVSLSCDLSHYLAKERTARRLLKRLEGLGYDVTKVMAPQCQVGMAYEPQDKAAMPAGTRARTGGKRSGFWIHQPDFHTKGTESPISR
jgi:hypothetical protein